MTADTHIVYAVTDTGERVRVSTELRWDAAIRQWRELDDARVAEPRDYPHVRFYAVRHAEDPAWPRFSRLRAAYTLPLARGLHKHAGDAASGAYRARGGRPADGGWFWKPSGRPLCQGKHNLARIAEQRGWIVQLADGRFGKTAPADTTAV